MDDSWHKRHDNDGRGDNKDRDYLALLMGSYLLTSGGGSCHTPLTHLMMMTQHRRRWEAASLSPGALVVPLMVAFLLVCRFTIAPLFRP